MLNVVNGGHSTADITYCNCDEPDDCPFTHVEDQCVVEVDNETPTQGSKPDVASKRYNTGSNRFDTFNWFMDCERSKLTPAICCVWLTFWGHADSDNISSYVSVDRIVKESGLSRNTVESAIKSLVAGGYLQRLQKGTKGRPTKYRVLSGKE